MAQNKRALSANLTSQSMKKLVEELQAYAKMLQAKTELFVQELADAGIPVIERNVNAAKYTYSDYDGITVRSGSDTAHSTHVEIETNGRKSTAYLVLRGEEILFIEFGSGVHYNTPAGSSPHPKGEQFGYTIGSYGLGRGKNEYWSFEDDSGDFVFSHGTKATMPMYKAEQKIIKNYVSIAKRVFGGG